MYQCFPDSKTLKNLRKDLKIYYIIYFRFLNKVIIYIKLTKKII